MENWVDKAVLITLQTSPCSACFPFILDNLHIYVVFLFVCGVFFCGGGVVFNLAVIEKPGNRLKFDTWQDDHLSPLQHHCRARALPPSSCLCWDLPQPCSPFQLCHSSPLPFSLSPGAQEHPTHIKASLCARVSSDNSSWSQFN